MDLTFLTGLQFTCANCMHSALSTWLGEITSLGTVIAMPFLLPFMDFTCMLYRTMQLFNIFRFDITENKIQLVIYSCILKSLHQCQTHRWNHTNNGSSYNRKLG